MKKHTKDDDIVMEDTVEKKVEGLAQAIIAEDKERRAQELVRQPIHSPLSHTDILRRIYLTLHQNAPTGI